MTFTTWKYYNKDSPLFPSGLLGPVALRAEQTKLLDGAQWRSRRGSDLRTGSFFVADTRDSRMRGLSLSVSCTAQCQDCVHVAPGNHRCAGVDVRRADSVTTVERQLNDRIVTLYVRLLVDRELYMPGLDESQDLRRQIKARGAVTLARKCFSMASPLPRIGLPRAEDDPDFRFGFSAGQLPGRTPRAFAGDDPRAGDALGLQGLLLAPEAILQR